jgi:hypothetical protein
VSEDRRIGILDGAKNTFGLRVAVERKPAVHARDDKMELNQQVIGIVERTVARMSDSKALTAIVQEVDFRVLLCDLLHR